MISKAIILAGGQGERLRPLTNNIPKCMVKIFKKTILEHQIDCLRDCGIRDISVVTGHLSSKIQIENISLIKNTNFKTTNMLYGLFQARKKLHGSVIIVYGDIVFEKNVLKKLLRSKHDLSIVIDSKWQNLWKIRFRNPLDDAESLKLDNDQFIVDIGQKVNQINEIDGQFIGLMKFQGHGLKQVRNFYDKIKRKSSKNILNPNLSFDCSYMTDFLQYMIQNNFKLKAVIIKGGWLELDTINDYNLYNKLYSNNKLDQIFNPE